MSSKNVIIEIIDLCSYVDEKAVEIYGTLSRAAQLQELADFWKMMSAEEKDHVSYWMKLHEMAEEGMIPQLFDEPLKVKSELMEIVSKVDKILKESNCKPDTHTSFTIGYRMEFFMASIAYERLFQFIKDVDGKSPVDEYEEHIGKFIQGLEKYGKVTPELEMLSDTLSRLWSENKRLTAQSKEDPLTGLLNRRGFWELATPLIHLAKRNRYQIAVGIMDVDKFKKINDEFGHLEGDKLLRLVADSLDSVARRSDIVGRYGGDEFIMLLYRVEMEDLKPIAQRILEDVAERSKNIIHVSLSIGFCLGFVEGLPEEILEKMITAADDSMYSVKGPSHEKIKIVTA